MDKVDRHRVTLLGVATQLPRFRAPWPAFALDEAPPALPDKEPIARLRSHIVYGMLSKRKIRRF